MSGISTWRENLERERRRRMKEGNLTNNGDKTGVKRIRILTVLSSQAFQRSPLRKLNVFNSVR